jgi:hypothetical protein
MTLYQIIQTTQDGVQLGRCLEMTSSIFCVDGMWTGMLYTCIQCYIRSCMSISLVHVNHRAWKNHLRGVKPENQIDMYQTCILESETSKEVFHTRVKQFTEHWSMIEPQFISYFRDNYANRAGLNLLWL